MSLPGIEIPSDLSDAHRQFFESLKERIEVLSGDRGDPRTRAATIEELEKAGLLGVAVKSGYAHVTPGVGFGAGSSGRESIRGGIIGAATNIPLWLDLSNTAIAVTGSFANANGRARVYFGSLDVTDAAILSYDQDGLTGTVNTVANSPVAGQPKGYYEVSALAGDWGELTITASYGALRHSRKFVVTFLSTSGIESVGSLPVTDNFEGRVVFLTTDGKLYRYHSGAWTTAVPATDITGEIIASQIANAQISTAKFAAGIRPVEIVGTLPSAGTAGRVVFLTSDSKLYRDTGSSWTAAVPTVDLTGTIATGQIGPGAVTTAKIAIGAVTANEIAAGAISTDKLLVTDRSAALNSDPNFVDPSAWVEPSGIGSYSKGNHVIVSDGAVGTTALRSSPGAGNHFAINLPVPVDPTKVYRVRVKARNVAGNGVLYAGVAFYNTLPPFPYGSYFTAYYIPSAAGVSVPPDSVWREYELVFGATTAFTIDAAARYITVFLDLNWTGTAGYMEAQDLRVEEVIGSSLIAGGAITAEKIAANTITATEIAANAITSNELAANSVIAGKIAAAAVSATEIAAGSISAGHIVAATITTTQIAAATILAANIAAATITGNEIAADTITANNILAGTITAAKMATGTITAASGILADAVITSAKIADGQIVNAKIGNLEVDSAKIANLTVGTGKIANNAISQMIFATATAGSATTGATTEAVSASITSTGGPLLFIWGVELTHATSSNPAGCSSSLLRVSPAATIQTDSLTSSEVDNFLGTVLPANAHCWLEQPAAGSYTYKVNVTTPGGSGTWNWSDAVLVIMELKK